MKNNNPLDVIKEEILTALTSGGTLSMDELVTRCLSAEDRLQLIKALKGLIDAGDVIKKPCGLYRVATEMDRLAREVSQEVKPKKAKMKLSGVKVIRSTKTPLSDHAIRQFYDSAIIEQSEMLMSLFGLKSENTAALSRNTMIGRLAYMFYIYRDRVIMESDFNGLLAEPVEKYKQALGRLISSGLIQVKQAGYQWTGKVRYPFRVRTEHEEGILKCFPENFEHLFPSVNELIVKRIKSKFDKHAYGDKEVAIAHRLFSQACKEIRNALTTN